MQQTLLALGPFVFYAVAPSFQKLDFKASFRWVQQQRIAREPAAQFIGPDIKKVVLQGVLYPEVLPGGDLLPSMQNAARGGGVFPLIVMRDSGLAGDVIGLWVIKDIHSTREFWGNDGARKIEFTIDLESYGPDSGGIFSGLF